MIQNTIGHPNFFSYFFQNVFLVHSAGSRWKKGHEWDTGGSFALMNTVKRFLKWFRAGLDQKTFGKYPFPQIGYTMKWIKRKE